MATTHAEMLKVGEEPAKNDASRNGTTLNEEAGSAKNDASRNEVTREEGVSKARADEKLEKVMPGVVARTGKRGTTVRFFTMIKGRRFSETCPIPYELLVNQKTGKPTPMLRQAFAEFVGRHQKEVGWSDGMGLKVPTIGEWVDAFEEMAMKRCTISSYRYECRTAETAVKNVKMCVAESGLGKSEPVAKLLNTGMIRKIYESFRERVAGTSAWSYILSLKSATSNWTMERYQELGMKVESPIMPDVGTDKDPPRYHRLPKELKSAIDDWYMNMDKYLSEEQQIAVVLVRCLAVRCGDTERLGPDNFYRNREDGFWHIKYTPHKTSKSSKRWVDYPVVDAVVDKIRELHGEKWEAGERFVKNARNAFIKINSSMRSVCGMGEEYTKAAYELRKLCIDETRQACGVRAAAAMAAENESTLDYYYSDSQTVTNVTPVLPSVMAGHGGRSV